MVLAPPGLLTPRWTPLRPHGEQYRLYTSSVKYAVAEAGRRSGKSELAKRHGVWSALTHHARSRFPDGYYKFGAPTRQQAKDLYWEDLQRMVPTHFIRKISETELWIDLINGARLCVVGLDAVKRIEGQPMDRFYGDEAQEWKAGIFDRTIWPALMTDGRDGRAWIYGVAREGPEFEELAKRAKSDDPDWGYFSWESASVLDPAALERVRSRMDPRTFEIEFRARRVSSSGRAYYAWSDDIHARERLRHMYNRRAPLELSLDFNVEPGVGAISQRLAFRTEERLRPDRPEVADVIDAFFGQIWIPYDSNTHRVCRRFVEDWGDHAGDVYVYGDPAGGQRKSSAEGQTDWSIVRDELGNHFGHDRVHILVRSAAPSVRARVNATNARLLTASGVVNTLVDPEHCDQIIADFNGVFTLPGTAGELNKKKDPKRTHISDGIGYRAEYLYSGDGETGGAAI